VTEALATNARKRGADRGLHHHPCPTASSPKPTDRSARRGKTNAVAHSDPAIVTVTSKWDRIRPVQDAAARLGRRALGGTPGGGPAQNVDNNRDSGAVKHFG
jgi:hypothetical protein